MCTSAYCLDEQEAASEKICKAAVAIAAPAIEAAVALAGDSAWCMHAESSQSQPAAQSSAAPSPAPRPNTGQPSPLDYAGKLLQQLLQFLHHWLLQLLAWFRPDAGGASQPASTAGVQREDGSGTAEGFDAAKPSTSVQIRLPTGAKLTGTFNASQTVADLRRCGNCVPQPCIGCLQVTPQHALHRWMDVGPIRLSMSS